MYSSNGKKANRDIVQFVPFREVQLNPDLLAQELLAELPGQVTQYMVLFLFYLGKYWKETRTSNSSQYRRNDATKNVNETRRSIKKSIIKYVQ